MKVFLTVGAGVLMALYTEASKLGDACSAKSNPCTSFGQHCAVYSNCNNQGQCACKPGYTAQGQGCIQVVSTNAACDNTLKKCGAFTTCTSGKCVCNTNYIDHPSNTMCMPNTAKKLGEACTTAKQCTDATGNSRCDTTCKCVIGRKQLNNNCVFATNGETCAATTMLCNTDIGLTCLNLKCACKTGTKWYAPLKRCVTDSVNTLVAENNPCQATPGTALCASSLTCLTCPHNSVSTLKCRKVTYAGASSVTLTLSTIILSILSIL